MLIIESHHIVALRQQYYREIKKHRMAKIYNILLKPGSKVME